MPSKVISVGADPELLRLRHAVLETAGFDVRSALGEDDAITTIQAVQCGTLLMCYSLSKRARKSLAQEFRRYCPGVDVSIVPPDWMVAQRSIIW